MLKMNLVETIVRKTEEYIRTANIYDLGIYKVIDIYIEYPDYTLSNIEILIEDKNSRYIPEIYSRREMDGTITDFKIQTTSYGSLKVDEIEEVIKYLNEAKEVVETLKKFFNI